MYVEVSRIRYEDIGAETMDALPIISVLYPLGKTSGLQFPALVPHYALACHLPAASCVRPPAGRPWKDDPIQRRRPRRTYVPMKYAVQQGERGKEGK